MLQLTAQQHSHFAELVARTCLDAVESFVAYATASIDEQEWREATVWQMQNMAVLCSLTAFTLGLLQQGICHKPQEGNGPFVVSGGAADAHKRLGTQFKAIRSKCAGSHVDLLLLTGYIEWLFSLLSTVTSPSAQIQE
jgi:hypothetical protein